MKKHSRLFYALFSVFLAAQAFTLYTLVRWILPVGGDPIAVILNLAIAAAFAYGDHLLLSE